MTQREGLTTGILSYLLWGFFPLYFRLLGRSGAFEIIGHRVVWCLAFCLLGVALVRSWDELAAILRAPRIWWTLVLSGHLILANWTIYVWAVNAGHTLDAALGYFVNPLFSALLGVVVLRERLSPIQWAAFGVGTAAVVVLLVGHSGQPLISLGLAVSFGFYGLVKKRLAVRPLAGLTAETLATTPLAVGYLVFLTEHGRSTFHGTYSLLLVVSGVATALPLLLFAFTASRVPLTVLGMMQYITPVMQFLVGLLVFGEHMSWQRWIGFSLVWLAVIMFSTHALMSTSRHRRPRVGPTAHPSRPADARRP